MTTTARADMTALASAVAEARQKLAAGVMIDLAPIGAQVADVCARLQTMPRAEAQDLLPLLTMLLDTFDRLEADVTHCHQRAQALMHGMGG